VRQSRVNSHRNCAAGDNCKSNGGKKEQRPHDATLIVSSRWRYRRKLAVGKQSSQRRCQWCLRGAPRRPQRASEGFSWPYPHFWKCFLPSGAPSHRAGKRYVTGITLHRFSAHQPRPCAQPMALSQRMYGSMALSHRTTYLRPYLDACGGLTSPLSVPDRPRGNNGQATKRTSGLLAATVLPKQRQGSDTGRQSHKPLTGALLPRKACPLRASKRT